MNQNKLCKTIIFIFFLLVNKLYGLDWPIYLAPFSQHPIFGTLGEYRSTPSIHFHKGVDIGEPAGTDVCHVGPKTKLSWGDIGTDNLKIGNYRYIHINPAAFKDGDEINTLAPIGKIKSPENHLHFEMFDGGSNPLSYLSPFSDTSDPTINSIKIYQNASTTELTNYLSGKVDIITDCKDSMSNGSATVAPYKVSYDVYDAIGSWKTGATNIQFDSVPSCAVSHLYASGSTLSKYLYIATNYSNGTDGYWDTSNYNDGSYKITITVADISSRSKSSDKFVVVDNNPPTGSITINSGATYTNSTLVTLTLSATDPGSGVGQMRFSNDGFSWTSWESYATFKSWSLPSGEGTKYVYVQFKDNLGRISTYSDSIILDTTPPTGSISLRDAWTLSEVYTSGLVQIHAYAYDNLSSISEIGFSNDNLNWVWQVFISSYWYNWSLSGADGLKTVYARLKDAAGNISGSVSDSIILDTTPPDAPGTPIDEGVYSIFTNITFSWTVASDAESGIISYWLQVGTALGGNDKLDADVGNVLSRTITSCEQGKTYYARVKARNGAGLWGNFSGNSDGIKIEITPPTEPVVIDDGDYTRNNTQLHASWSSSDPESGISEYQYAIGTTEGGTNIVNWTSAGINTEITHSGLNLSEGTYYFSVKARNGAGLWSEVGVSNGIIYDVTPPVNCSILINDGDIGTNSLFVRLTLSALDALSGVDKMRFSNDNINWSEWCPYGTTYDNWGLTSGEGEKYVYVQFKDKTGNVSESVGDTIIYDITPPATMISQPTSDSWHSGIIPISGTAQDYGTEPSGLKEYTVSYGAGSIPTGWTEITYSNTPVENGQLAVWDTVAALPLANGELYTIKLEAKDNAVNTAQTTVTIRVDNTPPVISNLKVTEITDRTATISWTTDDLSDTRIQGDGVGLEIFKFTG